MFRLESQAIQRSDLIEEPHHISGKQMITNLLEVVLKQIYHIYFYRF